MSVDLYNNNFLFNICLEFCIGYKVDKLLVSFFFGIYTVLDWQKYLYHDIGFILYLIMDPEHCMLYIL